MSIDSITPWAMTERTNTAWSARSADVGDVPSALGEQGGSSLDDAGADHHIRAPCGRDEPSVRTPGSVCWGPPDAFARVAAVQIDLMTGASSWEDAADLARKLEDAGFGGMLYTETTQVPWMQIAAASMAAPGCSSQPASPWRFRVARCSLLRWRTRSPPAPGSLPTWSAPRSRRTLSADSADFDRPAARMRDYVEAVKAAWRAFNRERIDHHGEFYEMTLLPPDWAPRRHDHEMKVDISAVGPMMTKVAPRSPTASTCIRCTPWRTRASSSARSSFTRGRARSERG